jgi:predicted CXXCH cytochrome family protein
MVLGLVVLIGFATLAFGSLSTGVTGEKSWYWQNPEPQGNALHRIDSVGDSDLWAVGEPGIVLHSSDGGTVWSAQDPETLTALRDVAFVTASTGWVVGDGGVVRKTADGGQTWRTQTVEGTESDLRGIAMVDSQTGWLCGSDGTIRCTSDGGTSWVIQSDEGTRFNDIAAADAQRAWAVGQAGTVWATDDGGTSWALQPNSASEELNAVTFVTSELGFAVGDAGTILRTESGGTTWTTPVSVDSDKNLTDVTFISASIGWAVADDGNILVTHDGGNEWWSATDNQQEPRQALHGVAALGDGATVAVGANGHMLRSLSVGQPWLPQSTEFADLYDVAFDSATQGCAVGAQGAVLHTTNGGATWTALDSGTTASLYGVDCVESGKGWVVGADGTIRTSVDATSWVGQSTPTSQTLYAVDFVDDDHGWIVGSDATVLHTVDGGSVSWEASQVVPSEVETLYAVSFVDTQTGWAVGEGGQIISTTDGGESWVSTPTPTSETLRGITFASSLVGFACGDGGTVLRTQDGGDLWELLEDVGVSSAISLTDIQAIEDTEVIVVGGAAGARSVVRRTTDRGETWTSQAPGAINVPRGVHVSGGSPAPAWIVGDGGMILRATEGVVPTTMMTVSPPAPDGDNGWYVTRPVITLTADVPGLTFYSWVSDTGPWQTYSGTVDSPAEGASELWYYSADPGGEAESPLMAEFKYDATPPSTPTLLVGSSESSDTVVLSWTASVDEPDPPGGSVIYEVRSSGSVVGTTSVNGMTLVGLSAETEYSFTVRAIDEAGNESADSEAASVLTLGASARPPLAVYARSMGHAGALVNWAETSGVVPPFQYRVWRSVAGSPFSAIATVAPSEGRSYADTNAPLFQEVRYGVSITDERGDGAVSTPTTYTTTMSRNLPAPVGITARNTASVTLTWSPSPLAATYHVYRSSASTATPATLTAQPVAVATYHDDTTAPYEEYWYRVASVDDSGNVGIPSPPVYIRTSTQTSTIDPPHGAFNANTSMCAVCHATHLATSPLSLLTGTTTNDAPLCLSCHDGTSASDVLSDYSDASRSSRHAVPFDEFEGDLNCSDCHGVHSAEQTETVKGLLRAGSSQSGNAFCYECHGAEAAAGVRGDLSGFERSAHGTGVVEPPSGTKVVCLGCHISHTSHETSLVPYSAEDRCLGCHSQGVLTGGATDIASKLSGNGADTRHDLRTADSSSTGSRLTCANCHEPHTSTATTPCVDPDRPTTTSTISAIGVTLCLRCHDDALPTSQDTSGWAAAPLAAGGATVTANVAASWESTSVHGDGASVSPQLRVSMAEKGLELVCRDCHDSHGSSNRFMLRESVSSLNGSGSADSLLVVPLAGGGADLRFFCDSCHDVTPAEHPAADLNQFPVDCTACHAHVSGGL